jgi:RNA polymerase sigma factor (sigma-70 family)
MKIPKGYTEEQVIKIITDITDKIAEQFAFGYYDADDIKQEAFIMAMKALNSFKPSRGELGGFLATHIRNRLLNLRRDKLIRHQNSPPCTCCTCAETCKKKFSDECDIYSKWKKRNALKRTLMEPVHTDLFEDENFCEEQNDNLELTDMVDEINEKLPSKFRGDYRRLLDGSPMSYNKKQQIIQMIKEILHKYA